MSMTFAAALRSSRVQAIADAIDAAATPGTMDIYTGPRPDNGAEITTQTILGTLTFSLPCGTVAGGVLTLSEITGDDGAAATVTENDLPLWARVRDGDGNHVLDWDVAETDADVIINTISIVAGGPINPSGVQTITEGGA